MQISIKDNHVEVDKLGKVKKITGTRFGTVLNLNPWSTPFETWCDITKVYAKPFEETIYTEAGKIIEPKIIHYMNEKIFPGRVTDPQDYFGKDYTKMRFDFWPQEKIFGGMWDALVLRANGKPRMVIEIKTTKRVEDWESSIPPYYELQAMLYAKLEGLTQYVFAVAFLDESIYEDPTKFVANEDTVKVMIRDLNDEFISGQMKEAELWYDNHITGLISPEFDEKKDAEILKELRTNRVEADESIEDYLATLDEVKPIIEENDRLMKEHTDRLKKAEDGLKKALSERFTDQDNKVSVKSSKYEFLLNRSVSESTVFDDVTFKSDHPELYDEYAKIERKETLRKQIKSL